MNAYIDKIGVIDKQGLNHIVSLEKGLNIITGRSSTGKSALIEIFDYCFGSSDFTIPEGVITKNAEIYFVLLKLKDRKLLLGRRNKSSKIFIKEFDESDFEDGCISLEVFFAHNFLTLPHFKKELGHYFGINITDTELELTSSFYRGQKNPSPSIRSFMSYMLQHQNLIANKHAVFYRFDEKEKREQAIEHFKIFLGLVDRKYFLISQKLDRYKSQLRKLEQLAPKIDGFRRSTKLRIESLLEEYEAIAGCCLGDITSDKAYKNPIKTLKELQKIQVKLDSSSSKNNKFIEDYEELRSEVISLRDKMNGIEDERYNLRKKIETIIEKVEIYLRNSG